MIEMKELDAKYVLHIPLFKYVENELASIDISELLDNLISRLHQNGFDSLYMTKVQSYYKKRFYDEILITIFTSASSPVSIFEEWFRKNNAMLCQEAFAYETGDKMVICNLSH